MECICFIYSEWDITHHEQLEKQSNSSSIQGYLAETNPLLRTNRTEQLLTLVIRQQTMLGIKVGRVASMGKNKIYENFSFCYHTVTMLLNNMHANVNDNVRMRQH